jgi:quinol monooxygenase YgiN
MRPPLCFSPSSRLNGSRPSRPGPAVQMDSGNYFALEGHGIPHGVRVGARTRLAAAQGRGKDFRDLHRCQAPSTTGVLRRLALPGRAIFHRYSSRTGKHLLRLVQERRRPQSVAVGRGFVDAEAGRAHVESAHFQAAIASLPRWLADVPEIVHTEVAGEGWSRMSEVKIDA